MPSKAVGTRAAQLLDRREQYALALADSLKAGKQKISSTKTVVVASTAALRDQMVARLAERCLSLKGANSVEDLGLQSTGGAKVRRVQKRDERLAKGTRRVAKVKQLARWTKAPQKRLFLGNARPAIVYGAEATGYPSR